MQINMLKQMLFLSVPLVKVTQAVLLFFCDLQIDATCKRINICVTMKMWQSMPWKKKQKVFYMEEKVFEISAKEVTIEVVDEATGKTYRRTLPIDYYETANGLVLRGENLDGSVSQLVFYTSRGMQRMQDLTGGGPDEDPCGTHK